MSEDRLREALDYSPRDTRRFNGHRLLGISCDESTHTDSFSCECGLVAGPYASVGLAFEFWLAHADKALAAAPEPAPAQPRPRIVCLCGSTRFYEAFMQANYEETMAGRIVLSVGFFMHRPDTAHGQSLGCTAEQKIALDALHKRKIDVADEVLVLNVGGYIGESTRSEIEHAEAQGKPIRYLEPGAAAIRKG